MPVPSLPVAPAELVHNASDLVVLYQWVLTVALAGWVALLGGVVAVARWLIRRCDAREDTAWQVIDSIRDAMQRMTELEAERQRIYRERGGQQRG